MSSDTPWSANNRIENTDPDGHQPTLAASSGQVHALWSSNQTLYHARLVDGAWSPAVRVASGEQPVVIAAPDSALHCLFVNRFLDVSQVYYIRWDGARWSLPEVVSRTPDSSIRPALALGSDGTLHAAWEDTTPGYPTIYHGTRREYAWSAVPVPNGRGSFPTLGIGRNAEVYLAWQDRLTSSNKFDVFCSLKVAGVWSTPENISDTPSCDSICPRLALSDAGAAHLIWQEEQAGLFGIRSADRQSGSWSQPATLSLPNTDCRLGRLVINRQGYCQALWAEGAQIRHRVRPAQPDATWRATETANGQCDSISDLAVCLAATGHLYVVWSGYYSAESRQLYHLQREPIFKHSVFLPIVQR